MRKKTSSTAATVSSARVSIKSAMASKPQSVEEETRADAAGCLIAVELGGEFPSLALAEGTARKVVVQHDGETPAAFAERLASGLDALFGRGIRLGSVALACNERLDDAAQNARRTLLGLCLGSMAKHRKGLAKLTAPARSSGRLRQGLSTLAQGLSDEWRTADLDVSVDFGTEALVTSSTATFVFTARVA